MSFFGARPGPVLVALIMLGTALVNLYQFAEIDADIPPHHRALPTQTTSVLQAVATIGVVMSRPEGFIMVGLALLPTLL